MTTQADIDALAAASDEAIAADNKLRGLIDELEPDAPPLPLPTISNMTATPATLATAGGDVTVDAVVTDATSMTLDGAAIASLPVIVAVTEDHTFTLVAHNATGSSNPGIVSVTVAAAMPPPTITNMTATPNALPVGGGEVTIDAIVTNAQSMTLDGQEIAGLPTTATTAVDHTFTLTAVNESGSQSATAGVTVQAAPPLPGVEDPLVIYDGSGGITATHLYAPLYVGWKYNGGDWIDKDGVEKGPTPFSEVTLKTGQTGPYLLDVTALVKLGGEPFICLRRYNTSNMGAIFNFQSRESGNGPKLLITSDDGATETIPVMYDVECNTSTSYEKGKTGTLVIGGTSGVYLRFPEPQKSFKSAQLVLNGNINTGGRLIAFKFACLRDPPPTETFTIKGDPRVFLETECFDGPETPYYTKAGVFNGAPSKPLDYGRVVDIGGGKKALQIMFDPSSNSVLSAYVCFPDFAEADEAAVEFEIRLLPEMVGGIADAFKLFAGWTSSSKADDVYFADWTRSDKDPPAWAMKNIPGRCGSLVNGTSGSKSHGNDSHTARFDMLNTPPVGHPLHGKWLPAQYVYWPEQKDTFGDFWPWSANNSMLSTDKWHTIAHRLKVNTCVGTAYEKDAEFDGYIDGKLAVRRRGFYLRTTDNPLIAQPVTASTPWAGVPSKLAIGRCWLDTYHGGVVKPNARCGFQIRNFRIAKFA